MDSKCLESFLIPEYEIATEGFKDKVKTILKTIWNGFLRMLENLAIFFKNLINKMKHGKTVHNDKETYKKNKELVDKYYDDISNLVTFLPYNLSAIVSCIYTVSTSFIKYEKLDDELANAYAESIKECEKGFEKMNERYDRISKNITGMIYLDEYLHDNIINKLSTANDRLDKAIEKIKKEIETVTKIEDTAQDNVMQEQQKRIAEFMQYIPKYTKLLNDFKSWVSTHISNDVITFEDKYKFYEKD